MSSKIHSNVVLRRGWVCTTRVLGQNFLEQLNNRNDKLKQHLWYGLFEYKRAEKLI